MTSALAGQHTFSAYAPARNPLIPNTGSPTLKVVTSRPTDSTSPATIMPMMPRRGARKPKATLIRSLYRPAELQAPHDAVARRHRGRDLPDADILVPTARLRHLPDLQHLGRPIP